MNLLKPSIGLLILTAQEMLGIDAAIIIGRSRKADVVDVRRIICGMSIRLGLSFSEVGRALNRDHTTIMHAVKTFNDYYDTEPQLQGKVALIEHRIKQITNATNTTIMKTAKFPKEPPLWPEEYTDMFSFNELTASGEIEEAVNKALENSASPMHYRQGNNFFTDNQLLVDELKDSLYGFEIPFRHIHIPKHYG